MAKVNKNDIDEWFWQLLDLDDKTINVEVQSEEPKKGTLEYDILHFMDNPDAYLKEKEDWNLKKKEFMALFRDCFNEIIGEFQSDPKQQIAVNCWGCKVSNKVDGYGRTIRSKTNGKM